MVPLESLLFVMIMKRAKVTTFDSVQVTWTQEAINFLNEFPEGHIRRRAHARIEKNARVQKVSHVSLEFARQIIHGKAAEEKSNGNGHQEPVAKSDETTPAESNGFTWSPEAEARLEQVPKGFMRDNTRSRVLDYAREQGVSHITYDICIKGIEHSVQVMTDMIQNGATLEDFLPQK